MSPSEEFFKVIKRTVGVAPIFAVLASVGCIFLFLVKVPKEQIGVVFVVPSAWVFVLLKLLVATMPRVSSEQMRGRPNPPKVFLFGTLLFLTALVTIDLFLSGLTFSYFGLPQAASISQNIAKWFALAFVAMVFGIAFFTVRKAIKDWADILVYGVWRVLIWPRRAANTVHWFQHAHRN